jgi:hypothetical protein
MPIDPDVQKELDELKTLIKAIPTGGYIHRHFRKL